MLPPAAAKIFVPSNVNVYTEKFEGNPVLIAVQLVPVFVERYPPLVVPAKI